MKGRGQKSGRTRVADASDSSDSDSDPRRLLGMKKATPKSVPNTEQQWVTPRGTASRPPRASSTKPAPNGVPKLTNLSALADDSTNTSAVQNNFMAMRSLQLRVLRGVRSARRSPVMSAFATPRTQDEITMRRSMMFNDSDSEEEEHSFHLRSVVSARGTPIQTRSPEKSTILTPVSSSGVACVVESSSTHPAAAARKQLDITTEFGQQSPDVSVSNDLLAPAPINGIQTSLRQLEENKRVVKSRQPTSRDRPAFPSMQDDSDDEDVPRDKLKRGAEERAEERAARAMKSAGADGQRGNTERRKTPQNQPQASKPPTPSNPAQRKEPTIKKKNLFRSEDEEELTKEVARLGDELRVQKRVASAQAKAVLDVRRETGDSVVELRALVKTLQSRVEQLERVTGIAPRAPADENDGNKPQPLKSRDFRASGKAGLNQQHRPRSPNQSKLEGGKVLGAMAMKAV